MYALSTLTSEIWPRVKVMTCHWIVDKICVKCHPNPKLHKKLWLGHNFNYLCNFALNLEIWTWVKLWYALMPWNKYLQMMVFLLLAGQTLAVWLLSLSPMFLNTCLPEEWLPRITRGGRLTTSSDGYQQSQDVLALQNHDTLLLRVHGEYNDVSHCVSWDFISLISRRCHAFSASSPPSVAT